MGDARDASDDAAMGPGSTLGRYELLVPIAAGGMARVWAARLVGQGGFSKIVALKTILPDYAGHVQFRSMFLDEARIAAKVRHPNVCETLDLGEANGALFLTMEWVDGPSIFQLLRSTRKDPATGADKPCRLPIDPRIAARIVADACAGLQAAHDLVDDDGTRLDVVHRDVSPHNILVSSSGLVKVTDFGVAKARGASHRTQAGEIKGKMAYMAPEQLLGSESLDARCDVFALGCVLYEMTTGHRAFAGAAEGEVVSKILTSTITLPSAHDESYPRELEAIVVRALARDRTLRIESADALRSHLEAYLASSGPAVTASNVGALARERCGEQMDRIRDQIRAACAGRRLEAPPEAMRPRLPSRPDRSDKAVAVDHASADGRGDARRTPILAAAGALVAASCIFGGALWFAIDRARATPASAAPAQPATTALVGPPPTSVSPAVSPTASASTAREDERRSPRVSFRMTPKTAFLVVDGVAMPPGVDAVQRPTDGRSIRVVVRADRHEDRVITVDADAPAAIDVALTAQGASARSGRTPAAKTSAAAPPASALPNPYE